jgi:four helix bundle protein
MSEIKVKEKGFRKLLVWQRAHALVLVVYRISAAFPKHEVYGLTSQLRRASVSVPANISEGHALGSDAQFLRHLRIAQGSLAEVEYYLVLARDLDYLDEGNCDEARSLRSEVGFLLPRLITSVEDRRK